jgi:glycerol-3-phosphate dehydrogenase
VFRYSGVRPLPRHDDEAPGFVSRDYRIESRPLPRTGAPDGTLLSLVGGKWTTFRALAENLSTDILKLLGVPRTVSTEGLAIGGGRDWPASEAAHLVWVTAHGDEVGADRAAVLLARYGTRASEVIDFLTDPTGAADASLAHNAAYTRREIEFLASTEGVVRLIDVLLRRTSMAFVGDVTTPLIEELALVVAPVLGWDAGRRAEEIELARGILSDVHGVELGPVSQDTVLVS